MRKLIAVLAVALGSSMAFAATDANSVDSGRDMKKDRAKEIRFRCEFHQSHKKRSDRCEVTGNVCVRFDEHGQMKDCRDDDDRGHDWDRDRDRIREGFAEVRCNNGFHENERVRAEVRRDRRGNGTDLVVFDTDHDHDFFLTMEEFERFDGDSDRDDTFVSRLRLTDGQLWGNCRVDTDRDRDHDHDHDHDHDQI